MVSTRASVPVVAETLAILGVRHAMVVHGGGQVRFSLSGEREIAGSPRLLLRGAGASPRIRGLEEPR